MHNDSVLLASGADLKVGSTFQDSNGDTQLVNADGSLTDLDKGTTQAGPNGSTLPVSWSPPGKSSPLGLAPNTQYTGSGPGVTLATGAQTTDGTIFNPGNGSDYLVEDGYVYNIETQSVTATPNGPPPSAVPDPNQVGQEGTHTGFNPKDGNVESGVGNEYSPGGSLSTSVPVILDLNGDGVRITPESSSNIFYDTAGDGQQHRTAWAGVGDGVLVLDVNNNGIIDQKDQIDFTTWDPTAQTDMQALKDVFDTNHDGKLDSGDTDWSEFKVLVTNADGTTSLETLSTLGIVSINLTSNNQEIDLPDGSAISGETTYTKSDSTTGLAADAVLASDANGYVVTRTVTLNGDGSTTIDNKASNADGSLANETISTISADGKTTSIKFDDDGDGVIDRFQSDVLVINGDGSKTETLSNYDSSDTILTSKQVTGTSSDGKTITISRDFTGSGSYDQTEVDATGVGGDLTVTLTDLNRNGSTHDKTITTTSADGLTKTIATQLTGSGVVNHTETDDTVVGGGGTRTETVTDYAGSGTGGINRISQVATAISSDGSTRTVTSDNDGDGTTDLTTSSTITHNMDGSTTTVVTDTNHDSSTRDKTTTQLSADGSSKTTSVDANGDGTTDQTTTDVTVLNGDGSTTETVTTKSGSGATLKKVATTWSADEKTRTTDTDTDGDGNYDVVETETTVSGSLVDTLSTYSLTGATLIAKVVSTTRLGGPQPDHADRCQWRRHL